MFDFFKKDKIEQLETVSEKLSAAVASELQGEKGPGSEQAKADNIIIHVMPSTFRNHPVKKESAKTAGLMIIIGGAVILIIALATTYYFLLRKPAIVITEEPLLVNQNNQPEEANQTEEEINQDDEISNTLTEIVPEITTLPSDNEIATTTIATTTPESLPNEEFGLSVGPDSDSDGLTDTEEIIFGTSAVAADTDADGYMDGSELMNLYNPAGQGKLTANANISIYENKTFTYGLLYPLTWQTSVNGGDDSLMFKTGDNQFVQVIVQPNVDKQALDQWYMKQLGVLIINETDRVAGSSWSGIKSSDGLNVYLMDKKQNYIFSLNYNPGGGNILEYLNIFQMMVKSFNLKD